MYYVKYAWDMIYTGLCLTDVLHYHDINCFATPYYEMWSYLHIK
jgi:hypothetical protein